MKRCYQRVKRTQSGTSDIISDLPRNLVENILMFLPIKDAAMTSILSRKWRYKWTTLSKLTFDDNLCQGSTGNQLTTPNKLLFIIYQVLMLHRSPIFDFTLSINILKSCSEVDQLLIFVLRNNLKKLKIHFDEGEAYKLPPSFFSCQHLTHLDLAYCVFKPPPSFKGFDMLTDLSFDDMIFDGEIFARFISSCLLLERLSLRSTTSFHFEINAPKLKHLSCGGDLESIYFKNTPLLAKLSVYPEAGFKHFEHGETSALIELFRCLPVIEILETDSYFYESLIADNVPKKLPASLINLKSLKLMGVSFGTLNDVCLVLCLLRSSPNLHKILIEMFAYEEATDRALEFPGADDFCDVVFDQLREVDLQVVSGTQCQLELIKLLLAKSPILESMVIEPKSRNVTERLELLQMLTRFQRASPKAELIFFPYNSIVN